jgi:hypothetical protein
MPSMPSRESREEVDAMPSEIPEPQVESKTEPRIEDVPEDGAESHAPTLNKPGKWRSLRGEVIAVVVVALILAFVMPPILTAIGQEFRITLLGRFLALAIVALGIDLIWGFTGLLSLGHGVFFSLGGYALAMHMKLQIPTDASIQLPEFMTLYGVTELPWFWQPFYSFPFTLVALVLIPALVAGILGYLVFRNRIRGVYFSILTQATTIIFFNFFNGQQKLINGTNGLTDFNTILGADVNAASTQRIFYLLTIVVLALLTPCVVGSPVVFLVDCWWRSVMMKRGSGFLAITPLALRSWCLRFPLA